MKQTVTVLVGNVGSGKSKFYEDNFDPGTDVRISQDLLGSKDACIDTMRAVLETGGSVVIDRVNFNQKQRKTWIDIANEFEAEAHAVYLYAPINVCYERLLNRKGHETIPEDMSNQRKMEIIEQFNKTLTTPSLAEGFKSIIMLRNYV